MIRWIRGLCNQNHFSKSIRSNEIVSKLFCHALLLSLHYASHLVAYRRLEWAKEHIRGPKSMKIEQCNQSCLSIAQSWSTKTKSFQSSTSGFCRTDLKYSRRSDRKAPTLWPKSLFFFSLNLFLYRFSCSKDPCVPSIFLSFCKPFSSQFRLCLCRLSHL